MQRTTWMMLLILSLPVAHPARAGAVSDLAQKMAEKLQEEPSQRDERRRS